MAQALPLSAARAVGCALGLIAYGLLRSQRRLALEHLDRALGRSLSRSARRAVARRAFCHLGENVMEWLQLANLSTAQLQRLVSSEGVEHLRQALSKGNGAIAITPHFGNWELIPLYLKSLGFEGGVLARRLRYPEYESFLITLRGSRGIPTYARGSLKEVAKVLRANQVVGMLPDQDMDSLEGVFVNFFGRPAHTPVGPAALSLMTGAPIIPCFILRESGRFRFIIEPPVPTPQTPDRAAALQALTQRWSDVIESYIRRYPDHWVWMHRRWKTQPPLKAAAPEPHIAPVLAACCLSLVIALNGCAKTPTPPKAVPERAAEPAAPGPDAAATQPLPADQQMSSFTLTGYETDGSKRWKLDGHGASVDGNIVTVLRPDAVGYQPDRTAYLTASVAQVNQTNRYIRLEHEVTIHTSDGLWLTAPILHWIPDQNQVATDSPVRIETDHMLVRGRGASGLTQLKQATIFHDVEVVLNPSDHDLPNLPMGDTRQVTITCDGPLAFDYEHDVATFDQNVHVADPNGDLYSDKLVAHIDPQNHTIRYAEATGRVRIHQNQNTAMSERAVYEPAIGKITLVGKPSLLVYPSQGSQSAQLSFGGLAGTKRDAPASEPAATKP